MMRITDILYTIPDILLIILLAMAIKEPLEGLAPSPASAGCRSSAPTWCPSSSSSPCCTGRHGAYRPLPGPDAEGERVRHRCRALGASGGRIIKKHLLTNCMGTLIVTTTLQIPSSIFTESYLSFLGLGVAAPCRPSARWRLTPSRA